MYTLMPQHDLQAQELRVQMLYWDSPEDGRARIFQLCTCSGKWNLQDMLFHSEHKKIFPQEWNLDDSSSIKPKYMS